MKKISSENLNFLLCGILGTLIICILVFNITNKFTNTSSNKDASNNHNKITEKEASHYLTFTYFSNPLFLTIMLSLIFNINIVINAINSTPKITTNITA